MVRFLTLLACGLALAAPSAAYRINPKKALSASGALQNAPAAQVKEVGNTAPATVVDVQKAPQGVLAQVGLMRSQLFLSVGRSLLSLGGSEPVLPEAGEEAQVGDHLLGQNGLDEAESAFVYRIVHTQFFVVVLFLTTVFTLCYRRSMAINEKARADPKYQFADEPEPDKMVMFKEGAGFAIPAMIMGAMEVFNEVVSTVSLGQTATPANLSAVGVINMIWNCFPMCICLGISGVLDALVGSAFGAGEHEITVVYLRRCRLICFTQLLWICPVLWNAEKILLALDQDPEVVEIAAHPLRLASFLVLMFFQVIPTLLFLRNRGDVLPSVWAFLLGNVAHVIGCVIFVVHLHLGNMGVVMSLSLNLGVMFVSVNTYLVFFSGVKDMGAWVLLMPEMPTQGNLEGIMSYIYLAVPAVFSATCETLYWEINTLFMGSMGKIILGSHVVVNSINAVISMSVLGIAGACTALVARATGAGLPRRAQELVKYQACFVIGLWSFFACMLAIFREHIVHLYTPSPLIQSVLVPLLLFLCMQQYTQNLQMSFSGCLRGLAMHKWVGLIHFLSFYIIALPVGWYLSFQMRLGIMGIYLGFASASATSFCCFAFCLSSIDWGKQAMSAKERLAKELKSGGK